MKKLITLFIAVLGSAFNTSAQEIKGVVVDATSKEVVPSATIIIEYSDKTGRNRQTLWGGCTDANPKLLLNDT